MATIGIAEAARLTGKHETTLHRAMKAGKLAFSVENGSRRIDPAELERVFPARRDAQGVQSNDSQWGDAGHAQALRERLIEEQAATIRDLRARLDRETEERRQLIAILTGPSRRPWWRRWFR